MKEIEPKLSDGSLHIGDNVVLYQNYTSLTRIFWIKP